MFVVIIQLYVYILAHQEVYIKSTQFLFINYTLRKLKAVAKKKKKKKKKKKESLRKKIPQRHTQYNKYVHVYSFHYQAMYIFRHRL